jgi:hypothetical protein
VRNQGSLGVYLERGCHPEEKRQRCADGRAPPWALSKHGHEQDRCDDHRHQQSDQRGLLTRRPPVGPPYRAPPAAWVTCVRQTRAASESDERCASVRAVVINNAASGAFVLQRLSHTQNSNRSRRGVDAPQNKFESTVRCC